MRKVHQLSVLVILVALIGLVTFDVSYAKVEPRHSRTNTYNSAGDYEATTYTKREKKEMPAQEAANSGYGEIAIAYPTGRISTSNLLIEKIYPHTVKLGEAYDYTIRVTNLTDLNLQGVSVSEKIPSGFNVASAMPNFSNRSGQDANWELGTLAPGAVRTIKVKGSVNSKADLPCCTSADYGVPALCHVSQVIQPKIALKLDAKSELTICERIPLEYTVTNTGDSELNNVMVEAKLPNGTVTSNGQQTVNIKVGGLKAGESQKSTIYARAQNTGSYTFSGKASSDDANASATQKSTKITQPKLTVSIASNKNQEYVGRTITFDLTVKNTGNSIANNATVTAEVPGNGRVESASAGGRASGRSVAWSIASLAPGASKDLSFTVVGTEIGQLQAQAMAKATCAEPVQDLAAANIKGIPALLLEVVDVQDPIELGGEQIYVINVTNQGTADATNLKIAAVLEGMKYISGTGNSQSTANGNNISMGTINKLSPKESAKWTVKVSGEKAGDLRFKVSMTSDQLTRPVEETESTYVY